MTDTENTLSVSVKSSEMPEEKKQLAVNVATEALKQYSVEKDVAAYVKKAFDKRYGPTWQCVVGYQFGGYVSHDQDDFIYIDLGNVGMLLFRCS
ncbi:unnamed protein product [Calicophoron daubneyi]|uniref:Dynein light chain n=1 Tax=Calicophoron daubneyi TaxID=300641 RepID=A0AAV2TN44_CALDB